jgi:ribonuclease BN (tRNA processing enzyme)
VNIQTFSATIRLIDSCNAAIKSGDAEILTMPINHPGGGTAYKLCEGEKSFVYMTDNELDFNLNYPVPRESFVTFARNADVLVHDTMFTEQEWKSRRGWGHSSFEAAIELAADAGIGTLVLFHHDPSHDDDTMDELVAFCKMLVKEKGISLNLTPAREGETIEL